MPARQSVGVFVVQVDGPANGSQISLRPRPKKCSSMNARASMVTRWSPRGFSQAICSTPIITPARCCGLTLVCVGPYFWNGLPLVRTGRLYQAPK